MKQLNFGTAGIPIEVPGKRTTLSGIRQVKKLGLSCMELEFVRSVNISEELAVDVKKVAKDNGIILTCHAPYFINLNSKEKPKYYASMHRILKSAYITNLCGGYSVCFHAGFYMGGDPKKVYTKIKKAVEDISKELKDKGVNLWLRPETTGKGTQFGDIDELIRLSKDVEQVLPCIDFSHLHARSNGKYNSYGETVEVLTKVEKDLGREALDNMHIHLSGIAYGEKGEKHHLILKESDLNYPEILKAWKEFKLKGVVICESPNIEKDALLLQKEYKS